MVKIGVAQIDITPSEPVWLVGYGDREHRSEGTYQPLRAGALLLHGREDSALLITADLIGYDLAFAAECKALLSDATGLLPRQIVLTATHTHCAPFFYPWIMPGHPEKNYPLFLKERLVEVAQRAQGNARPGAISFSRGTSTFGVNRRRPDGKGGVSFAPHPDGAMDRDLDTLWCTDLQDRPIASLTFFGCHPTSLGGYLIGGDYPGYLCRSIEEETGVPALFATGCAGNIRPWYGEDPNHFARPTFDELAAAGRVLAQEVLATFGDAVSVRADNLRIDNAFHLLPYANLPTSEALRESAESSDPRRREWAVTMQVQRSKGPLPDGCPQEIQALHLDDEYCALFLGGEVLAEIGLHLKAILQPRTAIACAYANGLIAYVPSEETYDLGGYEVDGSYHLFIRPAPFVRDVESRIVQQSTRLMNTLH